MSAASGKDCPRERDEGNIPEISRFFGIVIRMFIEAGGPHHRPHFHAYYQDHVGVYAIDTIEPIGGSLPARQGRLVVAWAEIHQLELIENWSALQAGGRAARIEPLR
ncbi:MAG: DUF4160 domain-containing protein [Thermoanaerobaculia bacterium]